ncbi:HAD domain-containing protein [Caballeronia sp. LZ001]|uniref:HAD domain-containing protein n=1 Tax=Caballeronia sp. LZ001 TaxID=3038553 RepID=UPI0038D4ADBF
MHRLAELLKSENDVQVVLSSSWVAKHGYRTVLDTLPSALSSRVVGATAPGNKRLRRLREEVPSRRDLLERDHLRREPDAVFLVDCDARYVPVQLREKALIVENGLWRAQDDTWVAIAERLKSLTLRGITARRNKVQKSY